MIIVIPKYFYTLILYKILVLTIYYYIMYITRHYNLAKDYESSVKIKSFRGNS